MKVGDKVVHRYFDCGVGIIKRIELPYCEVEWEEHPKLSLGSNDDLCHLHNIRMLELL